MKPSNWLFICSLVILLLVRVNGKEGKSCRKRVIVRIPRDLDEADRDDPQNDKEEVDLIPPGATSSAYLILPPGYNRFKIPWRSAADPVKVYLTLFVQKVLDFDELNEHITLEADIIVSWVDQKILDYRLNYTRDGIPIKKMTRLEANRRKRIINDPEVLKAVWKPNIFFENLITLKQPYVMARPVKLKVIAEAGLIQYSTRVSATVECGMEFQYYPADTQKCQFVIRPYAYTSTLVRLQYRGGGVSVYLNDTTLQSFDVRVDDLHTKSIVDDWDDEENVFSGLVFTIYVRRQLSYHVVQTYMASAFYIVITCLCFLLPHEMTEVKLGISMTTLLTLTAMFGSVRTSTPLTSYVKAIDTWMVYCISFVFLTLVQFTFYAWLRGYEEQKREDDKKIVRSGHEEQLLLGGGAIEMAEVRIREGTGVSLRELGLSKMTLFEKFGKIAFCLERLSFPIFTSIFALFSVLYWSWLLNSSDYFNWKVERSLNNVIDD